jgi:hypothetical protein
MKRDFFLDRFFKNAQISHFMKIRLQGAELFHADGRTDMTRLIVALLNFPSASKTYLRNTNMRYFGLWRRWLLWMIPSAMRYCVVWKKNQAFSDAATCLLLNSYRRIVVPSSTGLRMLCRWRHYGLSRRRERKHCKRPESSAAPLW